MTVSNLNVEAYNANYDSQINIWNTIKTDLKQVTNDINNYSRDDQFMLSMIDCREIIREIKELTYHGSMDLRSVAAWMYHLDQHVMLAEEDGADGKIDSLIDFCEKYCSEFAQMFKVDSDKLWTVKTVTYTMSPLTR